MIAEKNVFEHGRGRQRQWLVVADQIRPEVPKLLPTIMDEAEPFKRRPAN